MGYRRFRRPLTRVVVARRPSLVAHYAYLLYLLERNRDLSPNRFGKEKRPGRAGSQEARPGWIPLDLGIPLCLLTLLTYLRYLLYLLYLLTGTPDTK